MINVYAGADRAIQMMNRQFLKFFAKLRLAKFDEISVVRVVVDVYDRAVKSAIQRFYEVAVEAYIIAMIEAGIDNKEATRMADEDISHDWILAMLEEVDPVTLYAFMTETERKKQRLIETLSVVQNRDEEVNRALRYFAVQCAQYADNTVYWARLEAFSRAGIDRVQWVTQRDNRVCKDCDDLDGQIFPIDQVPPPQHIHCRCVLRPVR